MADTRLTYWTYERIDWDLLSDDLNSATGISPWVAWKTREEAIKAAESEESELVWDEDTNPNYLSGHIDDQITINVFPIRIEE